MQQFKQNGFKNFRMLTPLEEKNFYEKGYIKLTSFIPSSLLIKLHALFHELMNDADSDGKVIYENKGIHYDVQI